MRWQRYARVLVALIGIGCAVALVAYSRKRPSPPPPPPPVAVDPEATVQSGAGRLVRHKGNEEVGTIDYQSTKTYADGRVVFEKSAHRLGGGPGLRGVGRQVARAKGSR